MSSARDGTGGRRATTRHLIQAGACRRRGGARTGGALHLATGAGCPHWGSPRNQPDRVSGPSRRGAGRVLRRVRGALRRASSGIRLFRQCTGELARVPTLLARAPAEALRRASSGIRLFRQCTGELARVPVPLARVPAEAAEASVPPPPRLPREAGGPQEAVGGAGEVGQRREEGSASDVMLQSMTSASARSLQLQAQERHSPRFARWPPPQRWGRALRAR